MIMGLEKIPKFDEVKQWANNKFYSSDDDAEFNSVSTNALEAELAKVDNLNVYNRPSNIHWERVERVQNDNSTITFDGSYMPDGDPQNPLMLQIWMNSEESIELSVPDRTSYDYTEYDNTGFTEITGASEITLLNLSRGSNAGFGSWILHDDGYPVFGNVSGWLNRDGHGDRGASVASHGEIDTNDITEIELNRVSPSSSTIIDLFRRKVVDE